ncbi:MAG: ABC transporter permease, partial [Deltaproteobacteria bacterium]|nr:ABC transporter permease [Deltaproteobacteria bacterium]
SGDHETIHGAAFISQDSVQKNPVGSWVVKNGTKINLFDESDKIYQIRLGENPGDKGEFRFYFTSKANAELLLKKGKISLMIEETENIIQFHFDPRHSDSKIAFLLIKNGLPPEFIQNKKTDVTVISAIGNRYIDYLIPGLIAIGIMNSCIWGIGWTLIEMRMKKLLRRIVATPLKKHVFLISHFTNRLIITHFELLVLFLFAQFYFDITVEGSLLALFLMVLCGNIAFAGIAIALSCRAQQTIVANGLINLTTLPMFVVSGIFFSYHNFPELVLPIIKILPLTILADGIRSIFIEGSGVLDLTSSFSILIATGVISFLVGLKFFKWH